MAKGKKSKDNKDSPMTTEEVIKKTQDIVAQDLFAKFAALLQLGFSVSGAGQVVADGVKMFYEGVGSYLEGEAKRADEAEGKESK